MCSIEGAASIYFQCAGQPPVGIRLMQPEALLCIDVAHFFCSSTTMLLRCLQLMLYLHTKGNWFYSCAWQAVN